MKLNEYCSDKIIPLTIQSRVISGNTDTIHWGSYIHSWHTHSDFAELVIVVSGNAINNFPKAAKPPFTAVRTGINLHGSFDPNGRRALKVEPVLTLKTRVAQVRDLPAGTTLGYGRTWCLAAPSRIATISAGYADGLPMALANRGSVFIHGRRCPIVGRISMDYATVDVTGVPGVAAGDEVVCFGKCGRDSITPDDWAAIKGTHAYDILCGLGSRVVRRAVPAGKRQAAD